MTRWYRAPMSRAGAASHGDPVAYRPGLDGLRALAVTAVILFHLGHLPGGNLGVDTFFVLSGWLITWKLLSEAERRSGRHPIDLRHFWAARARRLLPASLAVITAVAVVWTVAGIPVASLRRDVLFATFWSSNWGTITAGGDYWSHFGEPSPLTHFWSLAVEEQFYLFWPVVVWFLPAARRKSVFFWGIVGTMVLRTVLLWTGIQGTYGAREYTFNRLDTLLLGALGALYVRDPEIRRQLKPVIDLVTKWWVMVPILFIGILPNAKLDSLPDEFFGKITYGPGLTVISVLFLAYVLRSVDGTLGPRTKRFTEWRFNLVLGKYSYAIYLFHFAIATTLQPHADTGKGLQVTGNAIIDSFIACGLTTALSLAIARVTWLAWEQPWLRLKRRFSYRT